MCFLVSVRQLTQDQLSVVRALFTSPLLFLTESPDSSPGHLTPQQVRWPGDHVTWWPVAGQMTSWSPALSWSLYCATGVVRVTRLLVTLPHWAGSRPDCPWTHRVWRVSLSSRVEHVTVCSGERWRHRPREAAACLQNKFKEHQRQLNCRSS